MSTTENDKIGSFTVSFELASQKAYVGVAYDPQGRALAFFIRDVINEIVRARKKFPSSELSMTALMEEVGELAKAYLDESRENVYKEAVQVACMASRVVLEGDVSIDDYREKRGIERVIKKGA